MSNKRFVMALIVVVVTMAILACSLLSSVPSIPSSVPSLPTSPSGNSGSGSNGGNGSNTSEVLLKDDFSDSSTNWGTGTDADSSVEYANGGLDISVFKTGLFVYSTPNDQAYQNVHIEVNIENHSTDDIATFGVMCDQQVTTDAYYYFGISPNGEYAINKAAVANDDTVLTNDGEWTASDLIKKNAASYQVGADCGSDGTLTLYVDGQKIDSVQDTSYSKGMVGVFAWSAEKPSGASVVFHDFVMSSLK